MKLQELLDKTNQILSTIQIHHRNTLNTNYNLHKVLWEIKDYLIEFIDIIWEDIVINWWKADFSVVSVDKKDNREEIYKDSEEILKDYLSDLVNFYRTTTSDEIENEYMWKTKELRKLYNKLMSTCLEIKEKKQDKKEMTRPKISMWIK